MKKICSVLAVLVGMAAALLFFATANENSWELPKD